MIDKHQRVLRSPFPRFPVRCRHNTVTAVEEEQAFDRRERSSYCSPTTPLAEVPEYMAAPGCHIVGTVSGYWRLCRLSSQLTKFEFARRKRFIIAVQAIDDTDGWKRPAQTGTYFVDDC